MAVVNVSVANGSIAAMGSGAGTNYLVQTPSNVRYLVYVDEASDVVFSKSTDGLSWSTPVVIFTGTTTQLSVWYDRWSNISAGLIHCAYTESVTDDVLYRTIDTESSDALSTQTVIFAGASTLAGGALSITRARGGNVLCMVCIDAGTESTFKKLLNANVPNGAWSAALTAGYENVTSDQWILMPGWAADNQDIMAFYWDESADEISRKLYDDSANTWGETSIAATMVDSVATTAFPHFAGAVDITNSRNLLVAWSAIDTAAAKLRCWHVTESAITEVTNVVTSSTDDQGLCGIGIDTDTQDWYVYYGGLTDGSDAFSGVTINYKKSTDDGATWGSETTVAGRTAATVTQLFCAPRFAGTPSVYYRLGTAMIVASTVPVYLGVMPTGNLGV